MLRIGFGYGVAVVSSLLSRRKSGNAGPVPGRLVVVGDEEAGTAALEVAGMLPTRDELKLA